MAHFELPALSPPSHIAMALLSTAINVRSSFFTSFFSPSLQPTLFASTLTKYTPFSSFTILPLCVLYVDSFRLSAIGSRKQISQLDPFRRDQAVNGSESFT